MTKIGGAMCKRPIKARTCDQERTKARFTTMNKRQDDAAQRCAVAPTSDEAPRNDRLIANDVHHGIVVAMIKKEERP